MGFDWKFDSNLDSIVTWEFDSKRGNQEFGSLHEWTCEVSIMDG